MGAGWLETLSLKYIHIIRQWGFVLIAVKATERLRKVKHSKNLLLKVQLGVPTILTTKLFSSSP